MEALELKEEDDEVKEQNEDGSSLDGKDQLFFDQKWCLGLRLMFFGLTWAIFMVKIRGNKTKEWLKGKAERERGRRDLSGLSDLDGRGFFF
jgi:hypothetical protein